jgi:hypothetical protein
LWSLVTFDLAEDVILQGAMFNGELLDLATSATKIPEQRAVPGSALRKRLEQPVHGRRVFGTRHIRSRRIRQ